jgi:hypothetical protein
MISRKALASLTLAALCLASGTTRARAGFTVTLDSTTPTNTGATQFNYSASIAGPDTIAPGDYFRIYDFGGLLNGTVTAPTGWSVATESGSVPPPNVALMHGDDPAVPNLLFTYNGRAPIGGPKTVSGFSAQSSASGSGNNWLKDFNGSLTTTAGLKINSVGEVLVPSGTILPPPSAVPEPSAVISCGLGLVGLGLAHARRARARRAG